jgi:transposase
VTIPSERKVSHDRQAYLPTLQPRLQARGRTPADRYGKSCTQLARELGIRVNQLYKWKQQIEQNQANAFPGSGRQSEAEGEVARLKRELERLREENEILKKAAAYFAKSLV